ncbi:MAG: lipid-A-disaccharide synthase [Myxococcales bacterium]
MSAELMVVALEASADLHGASVLRELETLHPGVRAFGAGGPRMRAQGFEALVRAEDVSVMGVAEVVPALPRILEALHALRDAAKERRPRAALLIDSPDFNLRLARMLRELRIPVAYFIGPSVWAWRTYRVKQIARDVARMLVILPFEAAFYERHGVKATYVGNPLADGLDFAEDITKGGPRPHPVAILSKGSDTPVDSAHPVLALLPGSRLQEIHRLWPPILAAARALREKQPDLQLVVPVAPTVDRGLLHAPDVLFVDGRAPEVLKAADAAIVASGTATLEAALAGTPLVVVYKTSWPTWLIGRMLVRVKHVSLVNLLAGRTLVPELLQSRCTADAIAAATAPLLDHASPERGRQLEGLQQIRAALAGRGSAARRAAEEVAHLLEEAPS